MCYAHIGLLHHTDASYEQNYACMYVRLTWGKRSNHTNTSPPQHPQTCCKKKAIIGTYAVKQELSLLPSGLMVSGTVEEWWTYGTSAVEEHWVITVLATYCYCTIIRYCVILCDLRRRHLTPLTMCSTSSTCTHVFSQHTPYTDNSRW